MFDLQNFHVLRITACSDHPVRNSAGEFIFGSHVLWEGANVSDGGKGSISPNVFAYDFTPLGSNSTLNVAFKVTNPDLFGENCLLHGLLDGSRIFASDVFTVRLSEVTMGLRVIEPRYAPYPLSLSGDFVWVLTPAEETQSASKLEYTSVDTTRLELYWISTDIHEIFLAGLSGIDVDFLRCTVPGLNSRMDLSSLRSEGNTFCLATLEMVTGAAFSMFSKEYDTVSGRPHFGVRGTGGHFNYKHYVAAKKGGSPGSLQRTVNTYDQAAMVQVLGSMAGYRPTWLYHNPHGYVNPTRLIGIPQLSNNPFFRQNNSPPLIAVNDRRRTRVFNQAFNGHAADLDNDHVFNATYGPQLGRQTPLQYLTSSIDRVTNLDRLNNTRPGTVNDIRRHPGVTATLQAFTRVDEKMSPCVERLLQSCDTHNTKQCSQVHWDDVPQWVEGVLGANCDIAFQETCIGSGVIESLWHITAVEDVDDDVVVRVRVETRVGAGGNLDYEGSCHAAFDEFVSTLDDVQIDLGPDCEELEALWSPAPFGDFARYALQHAPDVLEGRILILSGNFMIDVSGGSSSTALYPIVRKLLAYTTVDKPISLRIPQVEYCSYEAPLDTRDASKPSVVKGIFSSFDIKCRLDDIIIAASADAGGYGLLLNKYAIESNEVDKISMVTFTFVARKLGTHDVDLRFEAASTMVESSKRIQVTVVEA